MDSSSIRQQALGGVFWTAVERTGTTVAQFVVSIILARLLSPAEFGLVGMIGVFLVVSQSFVDSGFGKALIQRKSPTRLDESSVFYFNIIVSVFCMALLWIAAPYISAFYKEPALIAITRAMSCILVIGAFGSIQINLLTKSLDFKSQAFISMSATLISGLIAIAMAYHGYGVWSLVVMSIVGSFVTSVLYWFMSRWRPLIQFSLVSLKSYFSFGSKLLVSGIIDQIFTNLYPVIIGKLFSANVVGYYNRAQTFSQVASNSIIGVASKVLLPTLCAVNHDINRLRRIVERGMIVLVFLVFPVMVGLFVTAYPLIIFLLTDKWLPVVPILQVLCFMGIFLPLHIINLQVLQALGRSDLFLKLEIVKKATLIFSIALSFRYGIILMLVSHVFFVSFAGFAINAFYTGKLIGFGARQQFRAISSIFAAGLFMGFVIYPIQWLHLPLIALLMLQTGLGIVVYLAVSRVFKLEALHELVDLMAHYLPERHMRRLRRVFIG